MSGEHGEPWTVDEYDSVIIDSHCDEIGEIYNHRIVACLAACDGMATEQLTPGCVKVMVEALQECVDIFGSNASQKHKDRALEMATAALAAMKGV